MGSADAEGKNSFDLLAPCTRAEPEHIEYTLDDGRRVKIEIRPSKTDGSEVF